MRKSGPYGASLSLSVAYRKSARLNVSSSLCRRAPMHATFQVRFIRLVGDFKAFFF